MKAEELMIGDWIKNKFQERIFQILNVGKNYVGEKHSDGMIEGHKEQCLEPIPLTPEILEENGFVEGNKGRESMGYLMYRLYDEYNTCKLGVRWYIKDSEGEISLNSAPYFIIIKYVHQLQHVLRLCGIEREIGL